MKSFFAKFLVVFIFGFLPVLSGGLIASHLIEHRETRKIEEITAALREKLIQIADAGETESFYFSTFSTIAAEFGRTGAADPARLGRIALHSQKLCGKELAVYFFDEKGEYLPIPGQAPNNRFVVGKIWDILAETDAFQPGDELRQQKKMQALLGSEANAGSLKKAEGQPISLKKLRTEGYFFWQRVRPESKSGTIIIAPRLIDTPEILQRLYRSTDGVLSRESFHFAFWNHRGGQAAFPASSLGNLEFFRNRLQNAGDAAIVEKGRVWALLNTRNCQFVGSLPLQINQNRTAAGLLNFIFAAVVAVLLLVLLHPRIDPSHIGLTIGSKLKAILLVAIVFPAGSLILVGIVAADTYEKVLLARLKNELSGKMAQIEDNFSRAEASFVDACSGLRKKVIEKPDCQWFEDECRRLLDTGQAVRIELRSLDGERISLVETGGWFFGLEKSQDAYGRYLIQTALAERRGREGVVIKRPPDQVFKDIFSSPDFGFVTISKGPDRVHSYRFGPNELFWYWTKIDIPGHPAALLNVFHSKNLARAKYLQETVKSAGQQGVVMKVYDQQRRQWTDTGFASRIEGEKVMRSAILTGLPEMRDIQNGRLLCFAYPGSILSPFSLMILVNSEPIKSQIRRLQSFLALILLAIFVVAALIARMLTGSFVKPVKELDRGLIRLQQRAPDAHVSIDTGDEFGELGLVFNRMVDDLKEMQLARTVQEALFPQTRLQIPGYETAVFNLAATDLGGDYCDHMRVSESKFLFLIGDVSGHGTPAALCMAMVKAAVFKACREGCAFAELPGSISSLLLRVLRRSKMMTMLFAMLNIEDNSLELINAGHNWPLILHDSGGVEEIKLIGIPLGIKENRGSSKTLRMLLEPGDLFFTYTDALVEVVNPAGEMFGHSAMFAELEKMSGRTPEEIILQMEKNWKTFMGNGSQQDDLTMLVLRRLKPAPGEEPHAV